MFIQCIAVRATTLIRASTFHCCRTTRNCKEISEWISNETANIRPLNVRTSFNVYKWEKNKFFQWAPPQVPLHWIRAIGSDLRIGRDFTTIPASDSEGADEYREFLTFNRFIPQRHHGTKDRSLIIWVFIIYLGEKASRNFSRNNVNHNKIVMR